MAAPHVSAIAALVGSQSPTLLDSPTDLKKRILDTAKDVGDTDGLTLTGRVADAAAAIDHTDPTTVSAGQLRLRHRDARFGSTTSSTRVRWLVRAPAPTTSAASARTHLTRASSVNGAAWTTVTASFDCGTVGSTRSCSDASRRLPTATWYVCSTGPATPATTSVDGPQVHPKLTAAAGHVTGATDSGTWTSRSHPSFFLQHRAAWSRYADEGRRNGLQFSFTRRASSR